MRLRSYLIRECESIIISYDDVVVRNDKISTYRIRMRLAKEIDIETCQTLYQNRIRLVMEYDIENCQTVYLILLIH